MLFLSREQWDAQPPRGGSFTALNRWRVKGVVVHHSGVDDPPKGVRAVYAFERHHLSKGWDGIGYNWLVDETGTIFEGQRIENGIFCIKINIIRRNVGYLSF